MKGQKKYVVKRKRTLWLMVMLGVGGSGSRAPCLGSRRSLPCPVPAPLGIGASGETLALHQE
jgi:hypothetical protein